MPEWEADYWEYVSRVKSYGEGYTPLSMEEWLKLNYPDLWAAEMFSQGAWPYA